MPTTHTPEARPATTHTASGKTVAVRWSDLASTRWSDLTTTTWAAFLTSQFSSAEARPATTHTLVAGP